MAMYWTAVVRESLRIHGDVGYLLVFLCIKRQKSDCCISLTHSLSLAQQLVDIILR